MTESRIGFIGVGLMGHGMAANVLRAGGGLAVIAHRNRAPVADLVGQGAHEAKTYAELAARSDTIILCVTNTPAVEQVVHALRDHLEPHHLIIDTSTSDPASTERLSQELQSRGIEFADAPLTGGAQQAAEGVLCAMVGARDHVFGRAESALSAFCSSVIHFGPPGSGHRAKLINNYLVMAMVVAITDTYRVARRADVDWGKLFGAMKFGSNYSEALRRILEPALEGDFDGYKFTVANALKDISYYTNFADQRQLTSDFAREVERYLEQAVADGHGDLMLSRLIDPANGDSHA